MKAIVGTTYRSPSSLEMKDVESPQLTTEKELLVRVHAASVNALDWHMATGKPYFMRLMVGLTKPKRTVRGADVSGVVEKVGAGVTRFGPGDEVFGLGNGSFAELASADEAEVSKKPAGLTFAEAAALPVAGVTALQALEKGRLEEGQRVLVIGAGGGVGAFTVQLAKARGAQVTGVCSATKVDLVRSLGADEVVDYSAEDFSQTSGRYDLIVDCVGNRPYRDLRRVLAPAGALVLVGGDAKGVVLGPIWKIAKGKLLDLLIRQRIIFFVAKVTSEALDALVSHYGPGKLAVPVDRTVSLPETPDAIDHLYTGHGRAKTVVVLLDT